MSDKASNQPYRGRIAPSPSGLLHLGHASTFLIAEARAKHARGILVFRNDDLDRERCKPHFTETAMNDLRWLGIQWHEGPDLGGNHGPYSQSLRADLYQNAFEQLRSGGWIYPCLCSRREVALALSAPHESQPRENYPGTCRPKAKSNSASPRKGFNWRFRIPEPAHLHFVDGSLGPQTSMAGVDFGDFLVWRKDDAPSYQLATVVDDHAMQICEVVRGADLVTSTFQQLLLYQALNLNPPSFFHCTLLCDKNGQRLAKRNDSRSLKNLRVQGLLPQEILNLIHRSPKT